MWVDWLQSCCCTWHQTRGQTMIQYDGRTTNLIACWICESTAGNSLSFTSYVASAVLYSNNTKQKAISLFKPKGEFWCILGGLQGEHRQIHSNVLGVFFWGGRGSVTSLRENQQSGTKVVLLMTNFKGHYICCHSSFPCVGWVGHVENPRLFYWC